MEPGSSLPCAKESAACPCPAIWIQSMFCHYHYLLLSPHLGIGLRSCLLPTDLPSPPHQNPAWRFSVLLAACLFHLALFDFMAHIKYKVECKSWCPSLKKFFPLYCHFLFLGSKYFTQHPILKHPQPTEHRLRVFENRVLMTLFGPRRESIYQSLFFSVSLVNENNGMVYAENFKWTLYLSELSCVNRLNTNSMTLAIINQILQVQDINYRPRSTIVSAKQMSRVSVTKWTLSGGFIKPHITGSLGR